MDLTEKTRSLWPKIEIQDGGRPPSWIFENLIFELWDPLGCWFSITVLNPPSWISILGHNFGVDQHFCAKFGTVIKKNRQSEGSQCSKIRFFMFSLLDPLMEVVYSGWWMTPKGGVAKITWPIFEAMGQYPRSTERISCFTYNLLAGYMLGPMNNLTAIFE